jgi:hypothetical protein
VSSSSTFLLVTLKYTSSKNGDNTKREQNIALMGAASPRDPISSTCVWGKHANPSDLLVFSTGKEPPA